MLGRDDGSILIMYACDALSKQLLENESAGLLDIHTCFSHIYWAINKLFEI